MSLIDTLRDRAKAASKRIVLPEGEDARILKAAAHLAESGIATPILLGRPNRIREKADTEGIRLPHTIKIIDPAQSERKQTYAQHLFQRRKERGLTYAEALEQVEDELYFGDEMVAGGDADGCVAGAAHPTPDVVRAAIHVHGTVPNSSLVSSFFLMVLPDGRPLTYADCGVMPSPDPEQLASIGIDAARNHRFLTDETPAVAFLSFSTKGSAEHPAVDAVREAVSIARSKAPELAIDGELQFDAAFDSEVGSRKAPDSSVAGKANVFVFPDLNAGNIGYKITQRIGGAEAFGPVLQGLARPANDLSRGCAWDDVVDVAAITALQADALVSERA